MIHGVFVASEPFSYNSQPLRITIILLDVPWCIIKKKNSTTIPHKSSPPKASMRPADILAFAFPSRPLHFQFYETHPTHRSNTRRLFPLGIPIEAKHRHPRLVCPRGGEGPPCPALVNHSSVPYSSKPNPSIHDLYLVEKKVGRGKNSGVPNRCATIWRPHACRSRQEPEKKHPFMTRFVALFYPSRRFVETSQSLSLYLSAPEIYGFHEDDTRTIESARADEVSLCKVEGEL